MSTMTVIVRNRVPQAMAHVQRRVELATAKAALDIEGEAKTRAPVDTGHLRNSIQASGRSADWRVDSPAEYSIFVEFGTRYMGAQPYLVPALEKVRPGYLVALKSIT